MFIAFWEGEYLMTVNIKKLLSLLCVLLCGASTAAAERMLLAELEMEQKGEQVKFELEIGRAHV